MKLRVGLVGLGDTWESRYRSALRVLSDRFEVRAVCAEVAQRAEQAAAEFGASAIDGFRALSGRGDIDAVLMLAPDWFGPLPILAACEAGKAVFCASALDLDPLQAKQIKQRVEQSGVAFMVELPRRHAPATLRLKELIATHLGPAQLLFCHHRMLVAAGNASSRRSLPVPPAMRDMLELVDWCRYVVGSEPTSVFGIRHEGKNGDDYEMMNLDFSQPCHSTDGPTSQISCGRYLPASWQEAIHFRRPAALQVCCENGVAFVDLPAKLTWFDEAGQHVEALDSERPVGEQLLTQFHRSVTSLVRKTSDLEDAYRALTIVRTARQSCQEGRRMALEF